MITFLSGGTGTPKLLTGFKDVCDDFSVIVNTAEDVWISGNKICPDIDSVIYALAGLIDEEKWWGIRGDVFKTHFRLRSLGMDEGMMIGDLDRATHIFRSELLRNGMNLTQVTEKLCKAFGISQRVIPMTNDEIETIILTDDGEMHFQEFWVVRKGEPEVFDVKIQNIERAKASDEAIEVLKMSKAAIIGPSNPVTSIGPIIKLRRIYEILKKKKVLAVSPFIGNKPFSGPAGKFMNALGYIPSPRGLANFYEEVVDIMIVHRGDYFESESCSVVEADILIKDKRDAVRLSKTILELL